VGGGVGVCQTTMDYTRIAATEKIQQTLGIQDESISFQKLTQSGYNGKLILPIFSLADTSNRILAWAIDRKSFRSSYSRGTPEGR